MEKKILLIITGMFFLSFISLVSAQVTMIPNSVDLGSVYPGESYSFNFTITSDQDYLLEFQSNNPYIIISPNQTIVNSPSTNITLIFTISSDTPSGNQIFNIDSFTPVIVQQVIVPSSTNQDNNNQGVVIYKDKIVNNTIYAENPNVNQTCPIEKTNPNLTESAIKNLVNSPRGIILIITLVLILFSLIIFVIIKRIESNRKRR